MQSTLIAGDTLDFLTTVAEYPPAGGWTLKFRLVPRSGALTVITFDAATSGVDYRVQLGPATTGLWSAGDYGWTSYVEKSGARHTVESGYVTIKPDPATLAAGADTRSIARKAVAELEAALATYTASNGHVQEYSIAGRSMTFRGADEIVKLLNHWRLELQREEAANAAAAGRASPRRYFLRASNA